MGEVTRSVWFVCDLLAAVYEVAGGGSVGWIVVGVFKYFGPKGADGMGAGVFEREFRAGEEI